MLNRAAVLGVAASLGVVIAMSGCGGDTPTGNPAPPASQAPTGGSTSDGGAADTSGLAGITFPPGAVVNDLGANQKQYAVTGTTLEEVKTFFENQMIGAGYVRAQEASASRFYDKGTKRIQITWSDQQGTIRGVVRVTRG